jgi:hypothetical protein
LIFYEDPEEQKGSLWMRIFRNLMLGWAMFIALFGVGLISLLILFPPGEAIYRSITDGGCESGPTHRAVVDVGKATVLRVLGVRGDLSVEGRPGRATFQVEGRTCARIGSKRHLESIVLRTSHTGDEITVIADMPARVDDIRMNLVILVPEGFPRVEVEHGDGPVSVNDVTELQAVVGSGSLIATRIGGNVDVSSLDGSMALVDVEGDVAVNAIHGYGEVDLAGIGGNVTIGDNQSGPARISDIGGDVTIGSAGSGRLTVSDVAGDVSVDENPGGHITLERIEGSVHLPGNEERPGT